MKPRHLNGVFLLILMFLLPEFAFAAHPLITDDTGTQGKGRFQLELNSEFTYDKETQAGITTKETGGEAGAIFSAGIKDNIDLVFGLPYQWSKTEQDSAVASDEDGISDMSLEVKWRFFEKDSLSLALKPCISLPSGDEEKGLGNGKSSYSLTLMITTKELHPLAVHVNLGLAHNRYKLQADEDSNRKGIWHMSAAGEYEAVKDLKIVGNIGAERNPDKTSNTNPAFALAGIIYSIKENLSMDAGIKIGLNKPETDYTALVGVALKF